MIIAQPSSGAYLAGVEAAMTCEICRVEAALSEELVVQLAEMITFTEAHLHDEGRHVSIAIWPTSIGR